jgi:hypothetical protein
MLAGITATEVSQQMHAAEGALPHRVALASRLPDAGAGSVWPASVLVGACASAVLSAGAWLGVVVGGQRVPWPFAMWVAEHALLGTALGAIASVLLLLGRGFDPLLRDARERRAAAVRLTLLWSAVAQLCLISLAGPLARVPTGLVAGFAVGLGLWIPALRAWLGPGARVSRLPRLDPARAVVLVALLTLPLAGGLTLGSPGAERPGGSAPVPASLWRAWQFMLAR